MGKEGRGHEPGAIPSLNGYQYFLHSLFAGMIHENL
jgi:hypothetical protein